MQLAAQAHACLVYAKWYQIVDLWSLKLLLRVTSSQFSYRYTEEENTNEGIAVAEQARMDEVYIILVHSYGIDSALEKSEKFP